MEVSSVDRYEPEFKEAVNARNTTIWVTLNPLANSNQKLIFDLAIKYRLPSICARSDYADNGCLMAYGPGYSNEARLQQFRAAIQVMWLRNLQRRSQRGRRLTWAKFSKLCKRWLPTPKILHPYPSVWFACQHPR